MNFELLHNGSNIKESISLSRCYSTDRYGGTLDDLTVVFATQNNKVAFNKDDGLEIKTAAGFTTGTMHLDSCIGKDGVFTIRAVSCRHENKKKKSRIWNHVRLSKIIEDVAKNTGLTPLTYGIVDHAYSVVAQIMETDLHFLARICKREGYSIKCDNGKLIVFNEYYLENNSTPIAISKDAVESGYSFDRSVNGMASVTVRHYNMDTMRLISYTAEDKEISGGDDVRIEFLKDINEAQRYAKGYLRDANRFYITGLLSMTYNGNISAGTVADLSGFEEFDGRYVIYEVTHDYVREKTAIKVRKVLAY